MLALGSMRCCIFIVTVLLIAGCAPQGDRHADKKILRYNESGGITHLDPIYSERFEDIWAMSQIYNGLVRLDRHMRVMPDIAKWWRRDSTLTRYTFRLRQDVYFHDHPEFKGEKRRVVAQDFINSFQRVLDPENGSQGKFIFKNVDRKATENHMGMEAPNDSTLIIYLKQPQHSFLQMLTLAFCYVVPVEVVDSYGADFTRNPVGSGPFKFKVWHAGDKLVLMKNTNYHEKDANGNQLPYIDAVSISFITSPSTEYHKLMKGELDFISGLDDSYQNALLDGHGELKEELKDRLYLIKEPWLKTDYIGFQVDKEKEITKDSPIRLRSIRRAINHAINRQGMVNSVRSGIGVPANNGFVPEGINDYDGQKVKGYEYDPDKVKGYLFEAGYTGKGNKPSVTLVAANNYKSIAEYVMHDLNSNGFDCKLELVLPTVHKQMVSNFNTNFFRKSWTGDFPDPLNFLNLFHSGNFAPDNGPNYTHFSSPRFDRLYEEAESATSLGLRNALYYEMDQMIIDEAPVVPLFYDELVKFVSKRVSGLQTNAMNQLNLKYAKIKD